MRPLLPIPLHWLAQHQIIPVHDFVATPETHQLFDLAAAPSHDTLHIGDWSRPTGRARSRALRRPTTSTASPRSKLPLTLTTPAGSRLRPRRSAPTAPASIDEHARPASALPAIHCLRAATGVAAGMNQVQRAPASTLRSGCCGCPDAMHM